MATDVTTLGIEVDVSQIRQAVTALGDLGNEARKVENTVSGFGNSSKTSFEQGAKKATEYARSLEVVSAGANKITSAIARAAQRLTGFGDSSKRLATELVQVDASLNMVGESATRTGNAFARIANASTVSSMQRIRGIFADTGIAINTASSQLDGMAARMTRIAQSNAFAQLQRDANLSNLEMAKLRASVGDYSGAISSLGKASLAAKAGMAGASAAGAARSAATAQASYASEIEQTASKIDALQKQLSLDRTESFTAQKIKIENEYQQAITKTNETIARRMAQGSMTKAQGDELRTMKEQEASLNRQLKLKQLEEKQTQKNVQLAEGQIRFYKELGQLSGNYVDTTELQNRLIEEQAQKYRETLGISEELVQQWEYFTKLQYSRDPFDGAYRGLLRFQSEFADSAKAWEDATYNLAKSFTSQTRSMFDEFIDTGKVTLKGFGDMFRQLLKDLAWQAIAQPVIVSVVGNLTGGLMGGASAATGVMGGAGGSGAMGQATNAASGMMQNYAMKQLWSGTGANSLFGNITSGITNTINSAMASWFPTAYAAPNAIGTNFASNAFANTAYFYTGQM